MRSESEEAEEVAITLISAYTPQYFPREVLRATGAAVVGECAAGFVAKVWTGSGGWGQTLLGALARGWGPLDSGPDVVTATVARYVDTPLALPGAEVVEKMLLRRELWSGLVFFMLTSDGKLVGVTTAPPGGALLAILEGRGESSCWMPSTPLMESWVASEVLASWPWPLNPTPSFSAAPAVFERHLTVAPSRTLAWATGWDHGMGRAIARASRITKTLAREMSGLQWRVGAHTDLLRTWHQLALALS